MSDVLEKFLIDLRAAPKAAAPDGVVEFAIETVAQLFHNLQTRDGPAVELHDEVVRIARQQHLTLKQRVMQMYGFLLDCPKCKLAAIDAADQPPGAGRLQ